ncbi:hypothetical protein Goklo_019110, partial [Gossypium klotzschianum]|nr:hypothetical protein [Gossypium klotzschianum]
MFALAFNTHSFSMNQRLLVLENDKVTTVGNSTYNVEATMPRSGNVAPSGFYLLFVVHQGIPSQGIWKIDGPLGVRVMVATEVGRNKGFFCFFLNFGGFLGISKPDLGSTQKKGQKRGLGIFLPPWTVESSPVTGDRCGSNSPELWPLESAAPLGSPIWDPWGRGS